MLRISSSWPCYRHPGRGGLPHQGDFFGRQAVGFVHQVADFVFQVQGFGRKGTGRLDRSSVFVAEIRQPGRRQALLSVFNLPL